MSPRKTLITNLFSLSGMQIANYLLPLLTIPYIVRIIGPENFGLINFAQAFVSYFLLVISFSFDLSATRELALNKNNKQKVSEIFYSVFSAKILLFIICTIVFFFLIIFVEKFHKDFLLYVFTYLLIVGNVFFPTWFFQGMEKLTRLAFFNLSIRIVYTVSIFLFIKNQNDYLFIPLLSAIAQIVLGIAAFIYAIKFFNLKFSSAFIKESFQRYKEGFSIFTSNVAISLYSTTNIVILGFFAEHVHVGYFSAAMKLSMVFYGVILVPISIAFFPHIGSVMSNSREGGINILKKLTFIVGALTLFVSIILFVFAEPIVRIIFGVKFLEAITCVRIISFLPFVIGLNNIFAVQGLLNLKMDKQFLIITSAGAVLSIALNFILAPKFYENGTAAAWLLTESFITVAAFVVLLRKNINLFDPKYFKSYLLELKLNFKNRTL